MILLDECLLYIEESLVHCAFASPGTDTALQNLAGILNAGVLFESLKRRVADLRKNVKGKNPFRLKVYVTQLFPSSCMARTPQSHGILHPSPYLKLANNASFSLVLRAGAQVELVSIQKMTTVITDTQQGKIQDIMNLTNAKLFDMHRQLELSIANVDLLKSLLR